MALMVPALTSCHLVISTSSRIGLTCKCTGHRGSKGMQEYETLATPNWALQQHAPTLTGARVVHRPRKPVRRRDCGNCMRRHHQR